MSGDLSHMEPIMQARLLQKKQDVYDAAARAICQERCAFMGEPPCWKVSQEWPNPNCDDPGCHALAFAAMSAAV